MKIMASNSGMHSKKPASGRNVVAAASRWTRKDELADGWRRRKAAGLAKWRRRQAKIVAAYGDSLKIKIIEMTKSGEEAA